jgi:peptidoglycan/LPS O-acetylase OafA/YrhL
MDFVASKKLLAVQALRALAASSVVAYHVLLMLGHNGGYSLPTRHFGETGASGVDLFFVISGFIMIYTTHESFGRPHATAGFLRRRAIRIIPIYWFCTTLLVLLLAFFPALFLEVKFSWTNVVSSYLFLLSRISNGNVGTVLQTGWTLCFEVYFYLVFALLLNLPQKLFLVSSGCLFLAGIAVGTTSGSPPAWATVAMDPILFEFLIGSAIAFAFIRGNSLPPLLATATIITGVAMIAATGDLGFGKWTRVVSWGLPGGFILFGAISLERAGIKVPRIFVSVGDSSYSLYLVHPFVVPALGKLWMAQHLSERLPPVILFVLAFSASIVTGYVLYHSVERPMTRWLSQASRRPALGNSRIA